VGGLRERYGAAAYRRNAFCQIYRRWQKRLQRSMRQRHFAGEKIFVDYAGRTVPIYARSGEEAFRAHLFVSSMGASGCAYAEATRSGSGASADNSLRSTAEAPKVTLVRDGKRLEIKHLGFAACGSSIRQGEFAVPKSPDAPEPATNQGLGSSNVCRRSNSAFG
jgi:hypothetical protein